MYLYFSNVLQCTYRSYAPYATEKTYAQYCTRAENPTLPDATQEELKVKAYKEFKMGEFAMQLRKN